MTQIIITLCNFAYGIVFLAVSAVLSKRIYLAGGEKRLLANRVILAVFFWYFLALFLSFAGFFGAPDRFSKSDNIGIALILIIMAVPLTTFFLAWRRRGALRQLTESIGAEFFINIQIYRLLGGYFILLLIGETAPVLFALPTGIFDMVLGVSAPFVAYRLFRRSRFSVKAALIWNYASIIDFIAAFSIYFLYFPFKVLKVSPEKIMWAGFYPVAFVVLFVIPLSVIFNFIAIEKLRRKPYARWN